MVIFEITLTSCDQVVKIKREKRKDKERDKCYSNNVNLINDLDNVYLYFFNNLLTYYSLSRYFVDNFATKIRTKKNFLFILPSLTLVFELKMSHFKFKD